MMRWLAEAGHGCSVLTTARSGSPATFSVEEHLRRIAAPGRADAGASVQYSFRGLPVTLLLTRHNDALQPDAAEVLQYQQAAERLLDDFAPDCLIACDPHPTVWRALAAARKRGITTVFTIRALGYDDRRYFENVDHVFTTSRYVTDVYFEKLGLISTPIDSAIDWADVVAPTESRCFVTFVHPAPHKGLMLFARLADMLGSRRPDIPVLVVQSGQSAGSLNGIAGLDFTRYPQIMAAPPVPAPSDYLALTRILLAPSVWLEPFGRVAAEAMINGIPPIVGDRGGLPETIGGDFFAGGGGLVAPIPRWMTPEGLKLPAEEEVRPWFDAVCALWDDPAFYRSVARRAREIAEERYSEAVSRDRHVKYLTSLKAAASLFKEPGSFTSSVENPVEISCGNQGKLAKTSVL